MERTVFVILVISAIAGAILELSHQACFVGSQFDPETGTQPHWFINTDDPCTCTAIRMEGVIVHTALHKQAAPLETLILSEDPSKIQVFFKCSESTNECSNPEPLGLSDGRISDEQFRASSHFASHYASHARLNQNSHWRPFIAPNSWVEVVFIKPTFVAGVITLGSGTGSNDRVVMYKVKYQTLPSNSSVYEYIIDVYGNSQMFVGNFENATTPVTSFFDDIIAATVVRLEPLSWFGEIALRFELLGCHLE